MPKTDRLIKKILVAAIASICSLSPVMAMPIEGSSPYPPIPLNLSGEAFVNPNVMLFLDTSGSMCFDIYDTPPSGRITSSGMATKDYACYDTKIRPARNFLRSAQKIDIAAQAAKDLFAANPNVRWGLFTFDNRVSSNNSGILRAPIADYDSAQAANLINAVDEMDYAVLNWHGTNTPLTEAYIEMVHYFAGATSAYGKPTNGAGRYISPLQSQYSCQKNYIIDVTDGEPVEDNYFHTPDAILGNFAGNLPSVTAKAFASKLNISTYTVGFTTNQQMLSDAAKNGNGKYYAATDGAQLTADLQDAIQNIISKESSAAVPVSSGSSIFALNFNTSDWHGELLSYATVKDVPTGPPQKASSIATDRLVFTNYGAGTARSFVKVELNNQTMANDTATFGTNPSATLNFLLGNQPSRNEWRKRRSGLLGDFIDTSLAAMNKGSLVAAGGNDGLLHIFSGTSGSATPYKEVLAYAPSATLSKVQYVAQGNYGNDVNPHRYLVDGPIATQNIDTHGGNKTILVGALGRGGKGYYALNVSKINAVSPNQQNINQIGLWDKNAEDTSVWGSKSALGYTFGKPVIAQIINDSGIKEWVAIVSNGLNSGKKGAVYFLDLMTGNKIREIDVGNDGNKSGLGNLTVLDANNNDVADIIYAGDMNGDVWRIDIAGKSAVKIWQGSPNQPITAPIVLNKIDDNNYVVVFGTGSLLYSADKTDQHPQSLYGIYDDLRITAPDTLKYNVDRASGGKLLQQQITDTKTVNANTYREVSKNQMSSTKSGWYLDLPSTGITKERITGQMLVSANKLVLTTQIPAISQGDKCNSSSGDGWLMALDAKTGSGLNTQLFGGGYEKYVTFSNAKSAPSGVKSVHGMLSGLSISAPIIDTTPSSGIINYKDISGAINNTADYLKNSIGKRVIITYSIGVPAMEEHHSITDPNSSLSSGESFVNVTTAGGDLVNGKIAKQGFRVSWHEVSQE